MNGLKEHRNLLAQEKSDERFRAIETKLDAILAALSGTEKKVTTDAAGAVVSTQTVTSTGKK